MDWQAYLTHFAQLIAAYALADAVTALYHLVTDRGWNIKSQVGFFVNHHYYPHTMTFDLQPMLGGVPLAIAGLWFAPWFLIPLGIFVSFAQVPHYYTHHAAPLPVRWLQWCGLFVHPKQHASHHQGRFDRDFCVISGWNNWWINRIERWIPVRTMSH